MVGEMINCRSCRFCREISDDISECVRRPPVLVKRWTEEYEVDKHRILDWSLFPHVLTHEDWCGEFEPRSKEPLAKRIPLEELRTRTRNYLDCYVEHGDVLTYGDVIRYGRNALNDLRGFGMVSRNEVDDLMKQSGLEHEWFST